MPKSRRFHKAAALAALLAVLAGVGLLGLSLANNPVEASSGANIEVFTSETSYAPKGAERFGVTDIRAVPKHEMR